jgi:hypothetical protein
MPIVREAVTLRDAWLDGWWSWAVVIDNPNSNCVFNGGRDFPSSQRITIEAFDANNTLLDSSTRWTTLLPGLTGIHGMFTSVGSDLIDRIEVRGPNANDAICITDSDWGAIEFNNAQIRSERFSSTVSGIANSSFESDQTWVSVVAIVRNSAGSVIAIDSGSIERLPAGRSARFEISFFDATFPPNATVELFWNL